ncbi:MAG: hypothetical protein Q4G05_06220, partial [Clostridia bacterium]|nr:hypothetical protein [Clostridia bacterium]
NVYGIYDLSGGAWERTATFFNWKNSYIGYANTDNSNMESNVSANNFAYNTNGTIKVSSKYVTRYDNANDKAGDAITGWFGDESASDYSNEVFFARGGNCNIDGFKAGLFTSFYARGNRGSDHSFRVVLAF